MLDQDTATQYATYVYRDSFGDAFTSLMPGHFVSDSGLSLVVGETRAIHGFGIASSLPMSQQLLQLVDQLNQRNTVGHYWLAEGSDDDHWSLVGGFKHILRWENPDSWTSKLANVCQHSEALIDSNFERVRHLGGEPYWASMAPAETDVRAMALLSNLG